jgi:putative flavoprotein involved in K+ transport
MIRTGTVVVGAGQAGLAVSSLLSKCGEDHVVLERGGVAHRWRTERWESLRMITPNWMARLPDWSYSGGDPDGYMTAAHVARYLSAYGRSFGAPVYEDTQVEAIHPAARGFSVRTDQGSWWARSVVLATGATGTPFIPSASADLPPGVWQLPLRDYRGSEQLPPGGVLIVGASASGLSVADELARAGRDVVLSVGTHTWLPRQLAGRDIWWWLHKAGWLGQTIDRVPDARAARREPRFQLVGRRGEDLALADLTGRGVRLVGRVRAAAASHVSLADDLPATLRAARSSSARLLRMLTRLPTAHEVPLPPDPVVHRMTELDLRRAGISTVLWATGYRPSYPYLHAPVIDHTGEIIQRHGATPTAGLYVVGARFQHRRDSVFLDGVRHNARAVVDQLTGRPADLRRAA